MKMNFSEEAKISFANPVFDVTRNTLNATLQNLVDEIVEKNLNSGSVTLKINISTESVIINDNNAQMGTRPAMCVEIGADISYAMQQKGSCKVDVIPKAAEKEIVMDDSRTTHIVSRNEASGQLSMFNTWDEYKKDIEEGM